MQQMVQGSIISMDASNAADGAGTQQQVHHAAASAHVCTAGRLIHTA
jgi:hypothetical protein